MNSTYNDRRDRIASMLSMIRIESNYSQSALANELGMSRSTLCNWEDGTHIPNLIQILRWMNVTGRNPMTYLEMFLRPNELDSLLVVKDDDYVRNNFLKRMDYCANREILDLLFILSSDYGRSYKKTIRDMVANLHTDIGHRQIVATTIEYNYRNLKKDSCPGYIAADIHSLDDAIANGKNAYRKSEKGYNVFNEDIMIEYNKRISKSLKDTREESGMSVKQIARELVVSNATINNWENPNKAMPNFINMISWYEVTGANPTEQVQMILYPCMKFKTKEEEIENRKIIKERILELDIDDVRGLLFCLYGNHGSSPYAILQEWVANLHCPIEQIEMVSNMIRNNYENCEHLNRIVCPQNIRPNYSQS